MIVRVRTECRCTETDRNPSFSDIVRRMLCEQHAGIGSTGIARH